MPLIDWQGFTSRSTKVAHNPNDEAMFVVHSMLPVATASLLLLKCVKRTVKAQFYLSLP